MSTSPEEAGAREATVPAPGAAGQAVASMTWQDGMKAARIGQVRGRRWRSPGTLAGLVRAFIASPARAAGA
jgi:hypothetical protein